MKWYRGWRKGVIWTLGILIVLLVGLRLALPSIVEKYVNRKLASLPGYTGRIGKVSIHLIRGAYTIHGINVLKKEGEVPVPFFEARKVDFSMQWSELFHKSLVGEIEVNTCRVNFVKGKTEKETQTSIDDSWLDVVKELFPFKINRFAIRDGEIWFRDFYAKPKVDV